MTLTHAQTSTHLSAATAVGEAPTPLAAPSANTQHPHPHQIDDVFVLFSFILYLFPHSHLLLLFPSYRSSISSLDRIYFDFVALYQHTSTPPPPTPTPSPFTSARLV